MSFKLFKMFYLKSFMVVQIFMFLSMFQGSLGQSVNVITLVGSGSPNFADGTGAAASVNYPYSVAADSAGVVYVADSSNNRIRKISTGGQVTTLAGSGTASSSDGQGTTASFWNPQGIAVDLAGFVYVSDYSNHRIRKISPGVLFQL